MQTSTKLSRILKAFLGSLVDTYGVNNRLLTEIQM